MSDLRSPASRRSRHHQHHRTLQRGDVYAVPLTPAPPRGGIDPKPARCRTPVRPCSLHEEDVAICTAPAVCRTRCPGILRCGRTAWRAL